MQRSVKPDHQPDGWNLIVEESATAITLTNPSWSRICWASEPFLRTPELKARKSRGVASFNVSLSSAASLEVTESAVRSASIFAPITARTARSRTPTPIEIPRRCRRRDRAVCFSSGCSDLPDNRGETKDGRSAGSSVSSAMSPSLGSSVGSVTSTQAGPNSGSRPGLVREVIAQLVLENLSQGLITRKGVHDLELFRGLELRESLLA